MVEEDFLELLGAGEVHLASGGGPRAVAGGLDVGAELGREVVKDAGVRGDADGLHLGQEARERHLHVCQERRFAALVERPAQLVGQRVERGCEATRAHLGGGGPLADISEVEEGV